MSRPLNPVLGYCQPYTVRINLGRLWHPSLDKKDGLHPDVAKLAAKLSAGRLRNAQRQDWPPLLVVRAPRELLANTAVRVPLVFGSSHATALLMLGVNEMDVHVVDMANDAASQMLAWNALDLASRIDTNPLDQAKAFKQLKELKFVQEEIADILGITRSSISQSLQLLELDPSLHDMVRSGQLTTAHARLLAGLTPVVQQIKAAEFVRNRMTVRQATALVRGVKVSRWTQNGATHPAIASGDDERMSTLFSDQLQTPVLVKTNKSRKNGTTIGEIRIQWMGAEQFEHYAQLLGVDISDF